MVHVHVTVRDCGDVAGGSLLWRNLKTGGQYQIVNTVWLYCRVISPESPVA